MRLIIKCTDCGHPHESRPDKNQCQACGGGNFTPPVVECDGVSEVYEVANFVKMQLGEGRGDLALEALTAFRAFGKLDADLRRDLVEAKRLAAEQKKEEARKRRSEAKTTRKAEKTKPKSKSKPKPETESKPEPRSILRKSRVAMVGSALSLMLLQTILLGLLWHFTAGGSLPANVQIPTFIAGYARLALIGILVMAGYFYRRHSKQPSADGYGSRLFVLYPLAVLGISYLFKSNGDPVLIDLTLAAMAIVRVFSLTRAWKASLTILHFQYNLFRLLSWTVTLGCLVVCSADLWKGRLDAGPIYILLGSMMLNRMLSLRVVPWEALEKIGYGSPTSTSTPLLGREIQGLIDGAAKILAGGVSVLAPSPRYDVRVGQLVLSMLIGLRLLSLALMVAVAILHFFGVKTVWAVEHVHYWFPAVLSLVLLIGRPKLIRAFVDRRLMG